MHAENEMKSCVVPRDRWIGDGIGPETPMDARRRKVLGYKEDEMRRTGRIVWASFMGALLLGILVGSAEAKIDPATIAGMWLFDEGKGDIAADASENGNDGTVIGGADWVKGKFGTAIELDGSGSEYVSVADSDSLDMENEITVMFWVRTDKVMKDMWADRQAVVGKHYLEYEVGIYMAGQLHTYTSDGAGNYDEGIMASIAGKLPDGDADWEKGKWYHVAWTLDGKNEVAYVNGVKIGEYDKPNEGTRPGDHPLEIGRRVEGGIPVMGAIDEVAVFRAVLDETDVQMAMERGLAAATGITAVQPNGKLTTTWGWMKTR